MTLRAESFEKAKAEGARKHALGIARKMKKKGCETELIARITDLSIEEIVALEGLSQADK